MAPRLTIPQKPERSIQTVDQKARCIDKINMRIGELGAFDPSTIQKRHGDPQVKALEVSIETALAAAFGQDTKEYDRYRQAAHLDRAPCTYERILAGLTREAVMVSLVMKIYQKQYMQSMRQKPNRLPISNKRSELLRKK